MSDPLYSLHAILLGFYTIACMWRKDYIKWKHICIYLYWHNVFVQIKVIYWLRDLLGVRVLLVRAASHLVHSSGSKTGGRGRVPLNNVSMSFPVISGSVFMML